MGKHIGVMVLLVVASSCLVAGCAMLLEREAEITGKVELSDHPAAGSGGVAVSTDTRSTTTDDKGKFSLDGVILDDTSVTLVISKAGYVTVYKEMPITCPDKRSETNAPDVVVDAGTILLQKM